MEELKQLTSWYSMGDQTIKIQTQYGIVSFRSWLSMERRRIIGRGAQAVVRTHPRTNARALFVSF